MRVIRSEKPDFVILDRYNLCRTSIELQLGVSRLISEPTQPTDADPTGLPLASTNWAEAGDQMENPTPTPVWCCHRNCNSKPRLWLNRTDTGSVVLFLFFYEADKMMSYVWVLLKKKKKQNGAFYARFSDSQGYISPYFALNIFQLSLSLSPLKSHLTQNNDKLLRVFSFVCLLILLFFLFICLGKLKAWMIKYLSWFETLNVWLSLAVNPETHWVTIPKLPLPTHFPLTRESRNHGYLFE